MSINEKNILEIINFSKNYCRNNKPNQKSFVWYSKDSCTRKIFISINTSPSKRYKYINEAIDNGASAIIADIRINKSLLKKDLPILYNKYLATNHNKFLNYIYSQPLKNIHVIGITGTDGKTSQLHLLAQSLHLCKKKIGVISSEGNGIYPRLSKTNYTTPRIDVLFKYLQKFKEEKVKTVLIECSSQGLHQGRLDDIIFNMSILTNINRDHLDYHQSFKNYVQAKIKLLNATIGHIFLNKNCPYTMNNLKLISSKSVRHFYSSDLDLNYKNLSLKNTISNYYNLAVILQILKLEKLSKTKILDIFTKLKTVKGRNHFIKTKYKGTYIIDYAHTPSSLLVLLKSISSHSTYTGGKIIVVFGCGGDRDVWKRKKMGKIASTFSDHIILTDDNPRNEKPMKIINDIKTGIKTKHNLSIIPSRQKAIYKAISLAHKDDFIVIAGKGNENDILYKKYIIKHNDLKILEIGLK